MSKYKSKNKCIHTLQSNEYMSEHTVVKQMFLKCSEKYGINENSHKREKIT